MNTSDEITLIKKRATKFVDNNVHQEYDKEYKLGVYDGYVNGASIEHELAKGIVDYLIDELQTSKMYHLGITGLDSNAEIARKEKEGNTALIRGINRAIEYAREYFKN